MTVIDNFWFQSMETNKNVERNHKMRFQIPKQFKSEVDMLVAEYTQKAIEGTTQMAFAT